MRTGTGALPFTNGPHGARGSRLGPQSATVLRAGLEHAADSGPDMNKKTSAMRREW